MLEDVIKSVKDTEAEAAALVAGAEEKASAILRESGAAIEAQWTETRARAKAQRAAALSEAESLAIGASQRIAEQYAAQCATLRREGQAAVDGLVGELMESIFNGSC